MNPRTFVLELTNKGGWSKWVRLVQILKPDMEYNISERTYRLPRSIMVPNDRRSYISGIRDDRLPTITRRGIKPIPAAGGNWPAAGDFFWFLVFSALI